jgi:hypothetical protein
MNHSDPTSTYFAIFEIMNLICSASVDCAVAPVSLEGATSLTDPLDNLTGSGAAEPLTTTSTYGAGAF